MAVKAARKVPRAGFGMDASHVFPQSVLAANPLVQGVWLVLWCPDPVLDIGRGFLFAPWLSPSCQGGVCSPAAGVEALRVRFSQALSPRRRLLKQVRPV